MLNRYYDSMMKNYYGEVLDTLRAFDESYFSPKAYDEKSSVYRVETDDSGLTLSIDVPGVKPEDISCDIVDKEVRIKGKRRGEEFKYLYTVSKGYDVNSPEATLENGVLQLRFNKSASSQVRGVKINVK